ncbi:hypothetical protein ACT4R9_06475 [Ornithobacterium rhinotracheale]|uniref:hypothetical protein n=1 Tax=Ornithobacterium rhinotracheale TaxID=28251 RepID=UPI003FA42B69
MRTQKEIFSEIAISIIDVLPQGERFNYAILEIKRLVANIGFTGYYITPEEKKKWLDIFNFKLDTKCIEELYALTQTEFPIHENWNRAKYTLFSDGKMQMEYIWDQELQDEVDGYNNDIKPNA